MEERIREIMAEVFEVDIKEINESTTPETTGKWVSLKHMNLIVSLEDEFGITFKEDEIAELLSFNLICDAVKRRKN